MASPPSQPTPSPVQADQATINHFLSILAKLSSQGGFQRIERLLQDYEGVRHELDETRTTCSVLNSSLARAESGREAAEARSNESDRRVQASQQAIEEERRVSEGLREKISALEEEVRNITTTFKKYSSDMVRHENVAKSRLLELSKAEKRVEALDKELAAERETREKTASELEESRQTLGRFRSFVVDMTPLDSVRAQISQKQESAFNAALEVFGKAFTRDVEDSFLQDSAAWNRLKDNEALRRFRRPIPLPASNSTAAKRMRAFAALAVYANALARFVFRPTYAMPSGQLDTFLDAVARTSPLHEAYLRAVFQRVPPTGKEQSTEDCAKLVAEEVAKAFIGCIPEELVGELKPAILRLATAESENWIMVQRTEESVTPDFALAYAEDWRRLPVSRAASRHATNGQPAQSAPKQTGDGKRTGQSPNPGPIQDGEMIGAIWPAFLAAGAPQMPTDDGPEWDLVQPGYVLTQKDIKEAEEEVSHRGARQAIRRAGTGHGRPRRDSGVSFLSQKPSAGLDAK